MPTIVIRSHRYHWRPAWIRRLGCRLAEWSNIPFAEFGRSFGLDTLGFWLAGQQAVMTYETFPYPPPEVKLSPPTETFTIAGLDRMIAERKAELAELEHKAIRTAYYDPATGIIDPPALMLSGETIRLEPRKDTP